jgi:glycosyltransferase involved in cell wall biosynthesis
MKSTEILLPSLSIFFPCYNEEQNIGLLIQQAQELAPQIASKHEILVINDGSVDKTAQVVKHLAQNDEHIRLIEHPKNLGYGMSLRTGFANAKSEWVFFTDGDGQFDLNQLKEFIPATRSSTVVIGYRTNRAEGSLRALNARLFKLFIDVLFRVHVRDIDCAFKLLKTDLIQSLPLQSSGAMISAEILYRLKKKHLKVTQLPVRHLPRKYGQPSGNNIKVILKAFYEAFRLYASMKKQSLAMS